MRLTAPHLSVLELSDNLSYYSLNNAPLKSRKENAIQHLRWLGQKALLLEYAPEFSKVWSEVKSVHRRLVLVCCQSLLILTLKSIVPLS